MTRYALHRNGIRDEELPTAPKGQTRNPDPVSVAMMLTQYEPSRSEWVACLEAARHVGETPRDRSEKIPMEVLEDRLNAGIWRISSLARLAYRAAHPVQRVECELEGCDVAFQPAPGQRYCSELHKDRVRREGVA